MKNSRNLYFNAAIVCFLGAAATLLMAFLLNNVRIDTDEYAGFVLKRLPGGNATVSGIARYSSESGKSPVIHADLSEIAHLKFVFLPFRAPDGASDAEIINAIVRTRQVLHESNTPYIYEVRNGEIFQTTGNLAWRIFRWSYLYGSRVDTDMENASEGSLLSMVGIFRPAVGMPIEYGPEPLRSRPVVRLLTPFWLIVVFSTGGAILLAMSKTSQRPSKKTGRAK